MSTGMPSTEHASDSCIQTDNREFVGCVTQNESQPLLDKSITCAG